METKKTKALSVRIEKRELGWGGALPSFEGKSQSELTELCNKVAKVYGVPSLGITVMGGKPYINKDGRLFLMNSLRTGKRALKAIRTEFICISKSKDEPSIVKKTLVFFDGLEVEGIGEASKDSVKLEAVKQTLNMMAETRALNRAIWQAIAGDSWDRVAMNLRTSKLTEEEKQAVVDAGRVSVEEMPPSTITSQGEANKRQKQGTVDMALAKRGILFSKSRNQLFATAEKVEQSTKLTPPQKKELADLISARLDVLDNHTK